MASGQLVPGTAVITDELGQLPLIMNSLRYVLRVAFALIPYDPPNPVGPNRMNHGIINIGRILVAQCSGPGDGRWSQWLERILHRLARINLCIVLGKFLLKADERFFFSLALVPASALSKVLKAFFMDAGPDIILLNFPRQPSLNRRAGISPLNNPNGNL